MKTYVYLTGVGKRDKWLYALAKGLGAPVFEGDRSLMGGLSAFWGFGDPQESKIIHCMREGLPFLHLDHSYFKRGYEHGNARVNFCHFHQTRLIEGLPDDRMKPWRKRVMPWKKDGRFVVVIVPSERICAVLSDLKGVTIKPKDWARQTEETLKRYTDRPIYRKEKGEGLLGVLASAWAVVSLSSVAEVEAGVNGVPVFTSYDSPACQISEKDLSKIETPIYPEREDWLRTLSYSQFHRDELGDGTAITKIRELYGYHDLCGIKDSPQELCQQGHGS